MEITRYVTAKVFDEKAQECFEKIDEIMETMENIEQFIYATDKYVCTNKDSEISVVSEPMLDFLDILDNRLGHIKRHLDYVKSQA